MFCATLGTLPFRDRPHRMISLGRSTDENGCPWRRIKFQQRCIAVGKKRIAQIVTALFPVRIRSKKRGSYDPPHPCEKQPLGQDVRQNRCLASALVMNFPRLRLQAGTASARRGYQIRSVHWLLLRDTAMKVVFRSLLLIAPAVAVAAPAAWSEPNISAFSYTGSGSCLASPEGFNSKLELNNSGVAWTTTFTFSGSSDSRGNATEFGQAIDSASFGVGPRMHKPAAYAYQLSFSSSFRFVDEDKSDRFYIGSASGKFVTGPNAGIAFKVSDIELERFTD
jgi:hypothetical protein